MTAIWWAVCIIVLACCLLIPVVGSVVDRMDGPVRWYRLRHPRYVCALSCGFRSLWWSRMVAHYDGNCPKSEHVRLVMDRPPRVLDGHR